MKQHHMYRFLQLKRLTKLKKTAVKELYPPDSCNLIFYRPF